MATPSSVCVPAGFGRAYFKVAPDLFANDDAAYILAYSVIMLNTDRHNNQVCREVLSGRVWGVGLGFGVAIPLPVIMLHTDAAQRAGCPSNVREPPGGVLAAWS